MAKHVSIRRTDTLSKGLNFDTLRLRGIAYVQELSGDIWTDYNEHDPGVTLLEHLCYALTDLSYRAGFDIEDILYAEEGSGAASVDNGFFSSADILPTTPLTPTDYRRLLIDQIREIRNAWFYPIESHNRGYKGLFRIRIQLADGVDRTLRAQEVSAKVKALIMANRNLCEDLQEVIVLGTEYLTLSASISIEGDAFGEKVLARILQTIDQLLNPGIRFYSREELEAEGYGVEDIFDGPVPLHGFIKKEDLKPLPDNTYVSSIREAIARVKGVKMVENLIVWKNGIRILGDEIIPSPDTSLSLDPKLADGIGAEGNLTLYRNGVPISVNPRQTRQFLNTLSAKAKKGFQTKLDLSSSPVISHKKKSDLSAYRSFQRLMPAIYGLGEDGLPATANRARRAQTYQLKAYLLIFEQFMADYLAQLANVRDLFSIKPAGVEDPANNSHSATYFTQFPADIPDVEHLYYHGLPEQTPHEVIIEAINKDLRSLSSSYDPSDQRRNRFLDHILARFSETYTGDSLRFMEDHSQEKTDQALVQGKAEFLSKYPEISRDRSKGFNYTLPAWENENVSGLKKRVALSLNISGKTEGQIPKYANRSLSPAQFLQNVTLRNTPDPNTSGVQLSLLTMLKEGTNPGNYDVLKQGKKHELIFRDRAAQLSMSVGAAAGAKKVEEQGKVLFTGTEKQCLEARDNLVERLRKMNASGEGFYFLENILLRPGNAPGAILVFESSLPEGKGTVLLRSLSFTSEKSLNELSTDILVIATHPANWAVISIRDAWRTVLLKSGRPIMVSEAYQTKKEAQDASEHLQELCLNIRNQDPASINNFLRLESERFAGFDVSAGFYSLRLSIIAPAWPALFQNEDFRQLLQQVVATNIPAHLSVDYYWLEPGEMTVFDGLFKDWLTTIKTGDHGDAQKRSLKLIEFLQPDTIQSDDQGSGHKELHQKLSAALFTHLGNTFGYSFLFPATDFSLIQGLPSQIADLLPGLGVNDWKALKKASPGELVDAIHEAGQPATKSQISNWQKQATLALSERWTDLLRYQRRAVRSGGQATLSMANRTKVERTLQEAIRTPAVVYPGIRRWINRLPASDFIPYPIISFLTEAVGYNVILPDNDLRIFSCIDQAHEAALNDRGIYTWEHLSRMKDRSWKSVLKELQSADAVTDLEALRQEVALALAGEWQALLERQEPPASDLPPSPLAQRIAHHQEQLMAPVTSGSNRLLADRLTRLPVEKEKFKLSRPTINRLLGVISYGDLLADDDFQIFEGIGNRTETVLKEIGITNWGQLANSQPAELLERLEGQLNAGILRGLEGWIVQAKFAEDGKWSALIEWQKGPVKPDPNQETRITALEAAIKRWLERHALPDDETPRV